jgi:hypothetical protein
MTGIDQLTKIARERETTHPGECAITYTYDPAKYEPWIVTVPFVAEHGFSASTLDDAAAAALKQYEVVKARESEVPDVDEQ